MHIKICGLTLPVHVEAATAAGTEFIGFVFAERSRRHVTVQQAKRLTAVLPPRRSPVATSLPLEGAGRWFVRCAAAIDALMERGRPLVVGVFADQPAAIVNSIAEAVDLDLIQLSGNERLEACLQMRRPTLKTVRTVPGLTATALHRGIEPGMAHLIHLDAYVTGELGGTGTTAAWDVAAALSEEMPIMLAGGLTPENVAEAVVTVRPWAVDVSSGVERDGVKDVALIESFVRAARSAAVGTGTNGG